MNILVSTMLNAIVSKLHEIHKKIDFILEKDKWFELTFNLVLKASLSPI